MSLPLIPIDDPEDPRVEPYRAIRDRDLATRADGRPGCFLAEGEVVVRVLLSERSRFRPLSVLVADNRIASLADVIPGRVRDVPIYVAPARMLDAIAGFPIHRGLLAVGSRSDDVGSEDRLPAGPSLLLALVGLANHDNVGAAFRNAAAFGADAVLLDAESCDPLYRKAIRVSVGASLVVPFRRGGSAEALVATLLDAGYTPFALSPHGRETLEDTSWPARTALLVGAEGPGLPHALMERMRTVRIDMAPGFDSLNVGTAAGIALHAARRRAQLASAIDARGRPDTG